MLRFLFLFWLVWLSAGVVFADASTSRLTFDVTGVVGDLVKSTKEVIGGGFVDKKEEKKDEDKEDDFGNYAKSNLEGLNFCEMYDSIHLHTIVLDAQVAKAMFKIEKIEDTLDEEEMLRSEIFDKNTTKKLTELQKKERVVFRDMRKAIEQAKKFYKQIDEVTQETIKELEVIECEALNKKQEIFLSSRFSETDELLLEESIFRKSFSASLREKMLVLQTEVKSANK